MYDAVIIGGISYDQAGRPLGPYRLRTSAEQAGYAVKVIDFAWALSGADLHIYLRHFISKKTKILGISSSWFEKGDKINEWINPGFFENLLKEYPQLKIVVGGTKDVSSNILYDVADWRLTGFADIAFVSLLDKLAGKAVNLKYIKDPNGKNTIHSDVHYRVTDMDSIETVYKPEDGFLPYQAMTIEISRGCIFKCAFCTHPFLGKKDPNTYIRSVESIASELKRNYELFGTTRYMVTDDTFNDSFEKIDRLQRAIDLAKLPNFEFVGYLRSEILAIKPEMIKRLTDINMKGCHVGLESFGREARKMIGKGMDVNRVIDSLLKFVDYSGTKIHASLIVGLTGDTPEDFYKWQEFLESKQDVLFTRWAYNPLGISKSRGQHSLSQIDTDPEKYGYTVHDNPDSDMFLNWSRDDGLTLQECDTISTELNIRTQAIAKFGGWDLGSAWFHNIPQRDIDNKTINDSDFTAIQKSNGYRRANDNYNNIVKSK